MLIFRRLLGFLKPYKRGVTWSFVLAFGAMGTTVLIPYLTGRAVDAISNHDHHGLVIWAIAIVVTRVPCPLTALQNHFRESAGQAPLSDSFINLYIRGTFYPADQQTLARIVVALVVLGSWIGFVRLGRRKKDHLPVAEAC